MAIVLLRGAGGAGKTFLAEQVIAKLGGLNASVPFSAGPRGKTGGYIWFAPPVAVLGRYEAGCGGCDTWTWKGAPEDIEAAVASHTAHGRSVLLEGIAVGSYGIPRLLRMGPDLTVIHLSTSLDDCLAAIAARRALRGNTEPVNPYHTLKKHRGLITTSKTNQKLGIRVETLDRAAALPRVLELLGL